MPIVHAHKLEGKMVEQRRRLVKSVTEAFVESLGVKAEEVIIQIVDLLSHNVAVGGKIVLDRE